jgi:glycyl-tRNA synthetase beta chain
MVDFLLELNSEEIPARFLVEDVRRDVLFRDFLAKFGFAEDSLRSLRSFDAPRRIAFWVSDLPATLPPRSEEIRGPKTTAPADVVAKFQERYAAATFSIAETPKGTFHIATVTTPPIPLAQALAPAITDFIMTYPWPKSMTWGDTTLRWVRPLRRIVAMVDDQVLPGGLFLGHGNNQPQYVTDTTGPRILPYSNLSLGRLGLNGAPDVPVTPATYQHALENQGILAYSSDRYSQMVQKIVDLCKENHVPLPEGFPMDPMDILLDIHVSKLVDYPAPFIGRIDAEFMHLPAPIIKTVMAVHQKYFATQHSDGALAPYFVGVANRVDPDVPQGIIHGNERVLRARLSDAAFFWETDLKQPLESYNDHLKARTFHAGLAALGLDATVYGKVQRMLALAPVVAGLVRGVDLTKLLRAVSLSKADLATGMVGEFPELQGQVGSFYAHHQGEDAEIVAALRAQYLWGDAFPNTEALSLALALVDRLDSLLSFFAAGEKTTGSKDPYGLRRLAYGVVGLVLDNPHIPSFDVASVKNIAVTHHYPEAQKPFSESVFQDVQAFLLDKTITFLTENADIPLDIIRTVAPQDTSQGTSVDFALLAIKAKALADFQHRETLQATLIRLKGLGGDETSPVDEALLNDPLEKQVYQGMQSLPPLALPVTPEKETLRLHALVTLSQSVNAMLDALRINDPVYGVNRRALVRALLGRYTS